MRIYSSVDPHSELRLTRHPAPPPRRGGSLRGRSFPLCTGLPDTLADTAPHRHRAQMTDIGTPIMPAGEGILDFCAVGALVHRLDSGILPMRKATELKVRAAVANATAVRGGVRVRALA